MTTYVLTNNNDAIDFWDPTKIAEAIANDQNIINYDNSDSNDLLSFNRLKRSPLNPIGTDDEIRQARSHLPTPSRDYFNKLGVPMGKNVRMVADVDRESTHIKPANISITPWKHYGKLLFRTPEGLGTCTAAFLDERVLLTAAHCVKSFDWHSDFHFLHGYNSLSDKGRPIQIQNVLVPKRYDRFHDSWYGDLRYSFKMSKIIRLYRFFHLVITINHRFLIINC